MANNDIIELLDVLYGMVTEAWSVPLGNDKCIIERDKAIEIINDIKANLPGALAEAKRLVAARDEFIGNAKRDFCSARHGFPIGDFVAALLLAVGEGVEGVMGLVCAAHHIPGRLANANLQGGGRGLGSRAGRTGGGCF